MSENPVEIASMYFPAIEIDDSCFFVCEDSLATNYENISTSSNLWNENKNHFEIFFLIRVYLFFHVHFVLQSFFVLAVFFLVTHICINPDHRKRRGPSTSPLQDGGNVLVVFKSEPPKTINVPRAWKQEATSAVILSQVPCFFSDERNEFKKKRETPNVYVWL